MKYFFLAVLLTFVSVTSISFAVPVITYNASDKKIKIGDKTKFVINNKKSFTVQEILDDTSSIFFPAEMPNLGLSDNTFWAKFDFVNQSSDNLILKFNQPLLNEIYFYRIDGKDITEIIYSEKNPFSSRKYSYPGYAFDMHATRGDTITYLLKFKSNEPIVFDVDAGSDTVIAEEENFQEIITGIYIGIIFVMVFYNLFIYFTVLDISYLIYVFYILSIGFMHITLPGYGFKYIWPNFPAFNDFSVILFSALSAITAVEFLKIFLKTKKHVPFLNKLFLYFEIIFVITLAMYFAGNKILAFSIVQLCTFILSLFMIGVAARVVYIGYRPAIFFLIAWVVLLTAACIFICKDFGILPYNFFTTHVMQIGSGLEVVLLSFALADRINIFKKEKETSQAQALEALLQNELIIRNQNNVLENKVDERTRELKNTNQELSTILTELKQTQSQLVNAEKMASLGQLTAGIAHEINNPINFVVSNIKPLNRDIEDIYELIKLYEKINSEDASIKENIISAKKFRNEIDFDYLKQEIGQLLKGIEDGAMRTANIVKGLRIFSRLDENDLKRTDITEGIEATLTLLNPEINGSIELVKNYANLPKIECFPGKLNQVFMNILTNGIYAIKENTQRVEKGKLEITSSFDEQFVRISIKDNGIGMSDDVRRKIFDPFFTTKPIGKGTGLGMSITFSIINDHHGSINLHTQHYIGSEFIIQLPINYKN